MPRPGSALVRSEVFTPRRSSFAPWSTRLTSLHPSLQWQMTGPCSLLCDQVSYYNLLCIITSPKQNKNTYKSLKHSQFLTEVFTQLELFHIFVMPQKLLHKLTQKRKITLFCCFCKEPEKCDVHFYLAAFILKLEVGESIQKYIWYQYGVFLSILNLFSHQF